MPRATRLAAAIESAFAMEVDLIEGHDGIYEVSLDGQVQYSSRSNCTDGFPSDEEIFELLSRKIGLSPGAAIPSLAPGDDEDALACPLPGPDAVPKETAARPMTLLPMADPGCGCGPADSGQSDGSGCC